MFLARELASVLNHDGVHRTDDECVRRAQVYSALNKAVEAVYGKYPILRPVTGWPVFTAAVDALECNLRKSCGREAVEAFPDIAKLHAWLSLLIDGPGLLLDKLEQSVIA